MIGDNCSPREFQGKFRRSSTEDRMQSLPIETVLWHNFCCLGILYYWSRQGEGFVSPSQCKANLALRVSDTAVFRSLKVMHSCNMFGCFTSIRSPLKWGVGWKLNVSNLFISAKEASGQETVIPLASVLIRENKLASTLSWVVAIHTLTTQYNLSARQLKCFLR